MNDFFAKLARRALNIAPPVRPVIPPFFARETSGLERNQPNFTSPDEPVMSENSTGLSGPRQRSDSIVSSPMKLPDPELHVKTNKNILSEARWQNNPNEVPATEPISEINFSPLVRVEDRQYINKTETKSDGEATQESSSKNNGNNGNFRNFSGDTQSSLGPVHAPKQDKSEVPDIVQLSEPLNIRNSGQEVAAMPKHLWRNEVAQRHTTIQPLVNQRQNHLFNSQQRLPDKVQKEPANPVQRAVAPEPDAVIPTVQVSIGRIEVRAIMPPAPPQPNTRVERPNPTLTLGDYLKQRDGGKR